MSELTPRGVVPLLLCLLLPKRRLSRSPELRCRRRWRRRPPSPTSFVVFTLSRTRSLQSTCALPRSSVLSSSSSYTAACRAERCLSACHCRPSKVGVVRVKTSLLRWMNEGRKEGRKGRRRRVSSSPLSPYSACALRRALPPLLPSLIPMSFLVGGEEAGGRAGVSGFSSSCFLSSQRRPWPSTINSRPQHRRRAVRGSKSPSPTSNSTRNAQCCVSVCI